MKLPLAFAAVGACATAAAALAATAPAKKHTKAGNSAAKSSLITVKDLGKGWTAGSTGTPGLQLSCSGHRPNAKGIVERGVAGSPSFSSSQVGPFLSQTTSVYGSAKQAATVWKRAVTPGLIACVAQTVEAIRAQGVDVAITSKGNLPLSKVTSMTAGYRVVATLSSPKVKYKRKLYFDVVLVGQGSTLSEITFSSFESPVPAKVEHALALLVAHHISIPTA
jgi:hypothetical protein